MTLKDWLEKKHKHPALIVCTYAIAFLPWTFIASTDFITSDWKTVLKTRKTGHWILIVAGVPILLIAFYIAVQASAGEYAEMSTAIVAACFSLLHFLRTWWGLSQLNGFKRWAEKSIRDLRKLGIYPAKNDDDIKKSASELADSLKVNNSIVDNQMKHGLAICYLLYGDIIVLNNDKTTELDEDPESTCILSIWITAFSQFVWDLPMAAMPKQTLKKWKFVPTKPVDMWLRWSTAFTAQLLGNWVKEFKAVDDPAEGDTNESRYTTEEIALRRGRYFGAELAASACLHLLPIPDESHNEGNEKRSVGIGDPFLWDQWSTAEQNNHMRDGRFMKAEMFNFAVQNESIFPFNTAHNNSLHRLKKDFRHMERLSYAPYSEDLQRIKNELPVRWHETVLHFDYHKLEWLTILLHLADEPSSSVNTENAAQPSQPVSIGNAAQQSQPGSTGNAAQSSQHINTGNATQKSQSNSMTDTPFGAIANLQAQLSMESDTIINEYSLNSTMKTAEYPFFSLSSIPIAHEKFTLVSKTNKQVTRVGELIDCWLSLVAGKQITNMIEQTKSMDEWNKVCCIKEEPDNNEQPSDTGDMYDKRDVNKKLEETRLDWRAADFDQSYNLMDHYITFMGYRMEFVRSFIALLYAEIDARKVDSFLNRTKCISVRLPLTAHSVFKLDNLSAPHIESRGFKCVIINELQDLTESLLDEKWTKITTGGLTALGGDAKTCLTALMLLSFPSISLDVQESKNPSETNSENGSSTVSTEGYKITIKAVCGPQEIQLQVIIVEQYFCHLSVTYTRGTIVKCLKWVLWKEAFLGRLKGFRSWQSTCGLPCFPDFECVSASTTGTVQTNQNPPLLTMFSNWIPFRPSFCLFELKHYVLPIEEIKLVKSILLDRDIQKRKKESPTASSLSIVSDLSGIEALSTTYKDAKSSTIVGNVFFIAELLKTRLSQGSQNNARRQGQEDNSMMALQQQQMSAVVNADPNALERYLKLVEGKEEQKFWIAAIATIEAFVQRILGDMTCQTVETFNGITSSLAIINSFVSGWGGVQEQKTLYNIMASLCVIAPQPVSKELIPRMAKMVYLSALDIDVKTRSEYALMLSYVQRNTSRSETRTGPLQKFYLFFPHCLIKNNLRIIDFSYPDLSKSLREVAKEMLPKRTTVKNFFIRERDIVNENVMAETLTNEIQRIATLMVQDNIRGKTQFNTNIGDVAIARALFKYGIDKGNPNAMVNLGRLLHDGGPEFPSDPNQAVRFYKEAIREGHIGAMVNLGNLYQTGGRDLPQDADLAKHFYRKAMKKKHPGAKVNLANMFLNGDPEGNAIHAKKMYEEVINETGHVGAIVNLAYLLQTGKDPYVPAEPAEAKRLYELAINKAGNVPAMVNLGTLMKNGAPPDVVKNLEKAKELYNRAINEASDVDAMYNMGLLLLEEDQRTETDVQNAVKLFKRASDEGSDIESMLKLADIHKEGLPGVKREPKQARKWYEDVKKLKPTNVNAFLGLASLQSNREQAEILYRGALELEPRNVNVLLSLANFLSDEPSLTEDKISQAAGFFRQALEEMSDVREKANKELTLAKILAKSNVHKTLLDAKTEYEKLNEDYFVDTSIRVEATWRLGNLLERDELESDADEAKAERLYRAVAFDPDNNKEAMYSLGVLLRKKGERGGARGVFHRNYNHHHHEPSRVAMDELEEETRGSSLSASRAGEQNYEDAIDDDSASDDSASDDSASDGSSGEDSGGDDSSGADFEGGDYGDDNSGDDNSGVNNTGGDDTGDGNSGGDSSGGDGNGGDQSDGDDTGGDGSGSDDSDGDDSGSDDSGDDGSDSSQNEAGVIGNGPLRL